MIEELNKSYWQSGFSTEEEQMLEYKPGLTIIELVGFENDSVPTTGFGYRIAPIMSATDSGAVLVFEGVHLGSVIFTRHSVIDIRKETFLYSEPTSRRGLFST